MRTPFAAKNKEKRVSFSDFVIRHTLPQESSNRAGSHRAKDRQGGPESSSASPRSRGVYARRRPGASRDGLLLGLHAQLRLTRRVRVAA